MFNGRMVRIIRFLIIKKQTTYKETAKALGVTERMIRYDIDRINDILSLEKYPLIHKLPKGVLVYPDHLVLDGFIEESEVIYTGKERMSVLLLILLLRKEELKLNQLCRQFKVSRSTIKNDMAALEEVLQLEGLSIEYSDHFYLAGPRKKRIILLNQEFKKYINYLINPFTNYNSFEFYCIHIIHMAFEGISIPNVVLAVDRLLESLGCTLTNTSYSWYMSNIMVLVWFILRQKDYPLDLTVIPEYDKEKFMVFSQELSGIIKMEVTQDQVGKMAKLFDFTNKFAAFDETVDLIEAETVMFSLVSKLSERIHLPFEKDGILVEGLLSHMIPLLQRIKNNIDINENVISLLGPEDMEFHEIMCQVCKEVEILSQITNENEVVYLTICFMASRKRMSHTPRKRVLLVCGHGYGTTTMLKETLLSEYQIHIIDTIPLYKISSYPDWRNIDYVISTVKLNSRLPKPCTVVNPILKREDYLSIEELGISRKIILSNYYALEEKLSFLDKETKVRVMEVIEKELGYQTVKQRSNPNHFSSLLKFDCITITDQVLTWKEATRESAKSLERRGIIEEIYVDRMIDFMDQFGFYAVSDGSFALLHGKGDVGIHQTGISLLVNKTPISFGEKQVKIVFCLASKNARDHIPAVISLMRMVKTTPLIHDLELCVSCEEIYQKILEYEFEVS